MWTKYKFDVAYTVYVSLIMFMNYKLNNTCLMNLLPMPRIFQFLKDTCHLEHIVNYSCK